MTTSPPNDRTQVRLTTTETILIEVLASSAATPADVVMCSSLDLSANGLQVVVDSAIEPESILRLCIDLKDEAPLFLVGEVMWARPDEEAQGFRLGFRLFESEGTDIERWKTVLTNMIERSQG
ncbi:MAG: PilZ domain-containing protein [Pseudomonadales bacterium]|nr:PilZ domain-containing protein [Pseudomonadales bacterium]